ncbi:Fe2+-enterobactin ABC transporter substrate-binding protein [Pseudactinotalea sp.]|uniref:Fe2+-enterobactin ABC transporter substrate-binding protein n=1 Tax=Pseudactinotalea sp. TaxID=1926260 RepID=UPI003B3A0CAD
MRTHLRSAVALVAAVATLSLAACSTGPDDEATDPTGGTDETTSSESDGAWPRSVDHDSGTTEIPEQPLRIVSTSITLTGTLLAIDAPVVASAATSVSPITDDNGFFSQWADVATERGVEVLYPNLELDLEAIEVAEPDLIIGSTIGQDATVDAYDQLSEIAPTVMLDYGSATWQDLAAVLGEATGLEDQAAGVVADYDAWVAEQAAAITLPEQPVTALTYNGAEGGGIFSAGSAQAAVLTAMGFEYVEAPAELADETRSDVSFVTQENLPSALADVSTLFVVSSDDTQPLLSDPLLANQSAVVAESVLALGPTSFRIDYYSASAIVELLVEAYGA